MSSPLLSLPVEILDMILDSCVSMSSRHKPGKVAHRLPLAHAFEFTPNADKLSLTELAMPLELAERNIAHFTDMSGLLWTNQTLRHQYMRAVCKQMTLPIIAAPVPDTLPTTTVYLLYRGLLSALVSKVELTVPASPQDAAHIASCFPRLQHLSLVLASQPLNLVPGLQETYDPRDGLLEERILQRGMAADIKDQFRHWSQAIQRRGIGLTLSDSREPRGKIIARQGRCPRRLVWSFARYIVSHLRHVCLPRH
jgi:hypothetical protein